MRFFRFRSLLRELPMGPEKYIGGYLTCRGIDPCGMDGRLFCEASENISCKEELSAGVHCPYQYHDNMKRR